MSEDNKKDTDPEDIIRTRVIFRKDKVYFTLGEKSFMSHFPNESAFDGKELRSLIHFASRLISKAMAGQKLTWADVADQAERSGVGHKCLTDDIAKIIREHKC